jgi:hypothetical protein
MKGVAHERKSSLIKDGGTEDNHNANKYRGIVVAREFN